MRKLAVLALAFAAVLVAGEPRVIEHTVVYKVPGRFGGWPANHGIWTWDGGKEILVGFSAAYFMVKSPDRHQYDNKKPEVPALARTMDGGKTWKIEEPPNLGRPAEGAAIPALTEPIDFKNPNFAMKLWWEDRHGSADSWLWYSYDRGHNWRGPFRMPDFGQPWIAARTDYIVNGKHDAFVFLTAAKRNGKEGRVFCARTTDGGVHWKFVSWIGEEPAGFAIMPSSVRLTSKEIVTAIRVKQNQEHSSTDIYASADNAATWSFRAHATESGAFSGNPPSLLRLRDGRLAVTYGVRTAPFRICARLSSDEGRTWSEEFVLRGDAAAWDNGYTRSAQRADGKIVTIYYFPEQPQTERIIAATIWDPGTK